LEGSILITIFKKAMTKNK